MSATKLKTPMSDIVDMESVTIGDDAETLATAGATIPAGTTEVHCHAGAALHWHETGTPTSSIGHAVAAGEVFIISGRGKIDNAKIFSDDDNDQTLLVAYKGKATLTTP